MLYLGAADGLEAEGWMGLAAELGRMRPKWVRTWVFGWLLLSRLVIPDRSAGYRSG